MHSEQARERERQQRHANERAEILTCAQGILDKVLAKVELAPIGVAIDEPFLQEVLRFVEGVAEHCKDFEDEDKRASDTIPPADPHGERCLVCGHYHGGQGSCVTAHAMIRPDQCATCSPVESILSADDTLPPERS
jgi:hypothetical protein